ncbi:MAG: hypothetical protein FD174_2290 [Geobacteraceae bacterium]|nr:MAG: hypothetical protein FD174_2290 [Geobacteraceae bacterium]
MSTTDTDSQDLITVEEAAAELQTTHLRVLMLLKEKALVGAEIDGTWFVTRESLKCCVAHGKDLKVQMGCKTSCSTGGCGCK